MTLDEARDRVGLLVVYRAPHLKRTEQGEQGVITSVNDHFVFVRYGAQTGSQATPPELLESVS